MPPRRLGHVPATGRDVNVFLNIPYDSRFEKLYLAYIAGVSAFGLIPRATLELTASERRLSRISRLLQDCQYAVHDLSRVELDRTPPCTPRFNMPFELGLSVAWARIGSTPHSWYIFEAPAHRLEKSLSDLNGSDVHVHGGRIDGIFRELCNAFVRVSRRPTVPDMWRVYRDLRKSLPVILADAGAHSAFEARTFRDLSLVAKQSAVLHVRR